MIRGCKINDKKGTKKKIKIHNIVIVNCGCVFQYRYQMAPIQVKCSFFSERPYSNEGSMAPIKCSIAFFSRLNSSSTPNIKYKLKKQNKLAFSRYAKGKGLPLFLLLVNFLCDDKSEIVVTE